VPAPAFVMPVAVVPLAMTPPRVKVPALVRDRADGPGGRAQRGGSRAQVEVRAWSPAPPAKVKSPLIVSGLFPVVIAAPLVFVEGAAADLEGPPPLCPVPPRC